MPIAGSAPSDLPQGAIGRDSGVCDRRSIASAGVQLTVCSGAEGGPLPG